MDPRFDDIYSKPENQIFDIVFFPDRIYHAQFLNATVSSRYRYNVTEVRNKLDIAVLKGEVYLDGTLLTNFIRMEYRASRLIELVREKGRFLQESIMAYLKVTPSDQSKVADATVKLHFCPWIRAFEVEIWGTLEPPPGMTHDINSIKQVVTALRENDIDEPFGYMIQDPAWDNNYSRTIQVPNTQDPSAAQN